MSVTHGPDAHFAWHPEGWAIKKIRDVCLLVNGRGFKPHEWSDRGLPIIRIQNLNGSDGFNYYEGAFNPKIEVNSGDLLFAWSGSRGSSFGPHIWHGNRAVLNYHTWKVIPSTGIDAGYLFHALRGITGVIEANAHGASALVHMQKWEMEGVDLLIPDTPEQRVIAGALDDCDDLIGSLEQLIAKKQAIKQGMMQELLTCRTRLPGFTGQWTNIPLGDVTTLQRGFDLPTRLRQRGTIPIVSSSGVSGWHDRAMVKAPGVVTGRYGTIGEVFFETVDFWPLNTTLWVSNFHGNDARFIYYLLQRVDFASHSGKSGVPGVNRNDLHSELVSLPDSVAEQKAIAEALDDAETELAALRDRLSKARDLKIGMMQQLLTGRIRLPAQETAA